MADNGVAEPRVGEVNYAGNSGSHVNNGVSEPHVGMEFDSEDAAKTFYDEYARRIGFSSKAGLQGRSQADGAYMYREFVCGRDVSKRKPTDGCGAMIRIEQKGQKKWVVAKFVKEHSHSMASLGKVQNLQQRKHFSSVGRTMPETYHGVGLVPSGVMYISMDGNRVSTENVHGIRNISAAAATETSHPVKSPTLMNYTVRTPIQKRTLGRDAQNLLEYFKKMQVENPGFFYAIQLDENNHMSNVFWADARSRTAYSHFGDTVTLDTTYRVNHYKVPFAPFTGVNHHGHMILFGCALLLDDSEASFVWLFKTFLTAMNDHHPVSITTDQDRAIQTAVSKVFPQARHRLSKWDVLREGQQKLAHVCYTHPNFHFELYECINLTETIEDFDSSWNSIIDKYELRRNDWLQSLYGARAQWVPAYFRDSFFAAISPNQGFDGSFFYGFVNQQTTLPIFFRLYEQALESWYEKELESDFETMCTTPVLKTPSPMEKQAADLYTRKIFLKFQEELVETFAYTANRIEEDGANSIFRVAKFEDDQKAYTVILNHSELRANCSCKMFEYSGILCRHVLTVFTVTNVFTLPPHYILKRWTRNAKSSLESDENAGESHGPESLTSRYSNLCREAIRYAEEGAITVETYNAAMNALREGGKKITIMKKSVAKAGPPRHSVSGTGNDDKKAPTKTSDTTFLLWPPHFETFETYDAATNSLGESGKKIAVTKKSVAKVAPPSHSVSGTGNDGRKAPTSTSDTSSLLWPQQDETVENYDAAMDALREGGNKIALMKRSVAKVAPPSHPVSGTGNDDRRTPTSTSDTTSLLWPQQDETVETYDAAKNALREGGKKIAVAKRSFAKVTSPSHLVSGTGNDDRSTPTSTSDTASVLWPQQDETVEAYDAAMSAHRQGGKKLAVMKRSVAKATPPSHPVSGTGNDNRKTPTSTSDTTSILWPQQDETAKMFNLNDAGAPVQSVADLNLPQMSPVSFQRDHGPPENSVVLPCLRSMTWVMENKGSTPGDRVAVINLKLQDFSRTPPTESEVKFQLTKVSLEPMLESMTSISEQFSTPAHKVAVINLKLQETGIICGESEVKFQVSRDTLGAVLRSMAYIREQLSCAGDAQAEPVSKRPRK